MTDQEKKDLAESYQTMMNLAAWKHFEGILKNLETIATKTEDEIDIASLNLAQIAECRGRRNAIKQIRSQLHYILEGLT